MCQYLVSIRIGRCGVPQAACGLWRCVLLGLKLQCRLRRCDISHTKHVRTSTPLIFLHYNLPVFWTIQTTMSNVQHRVLTKSAAKLNNYIVVQKRYRSRLQGHTKLTQELYHNLRSPALFQTFYSERFCYFGTA